MFKPKAMLLNAVMLLSFVNFSGAVDFRSAQTVLQTGIKTSPAADQLFSAAPSPDLLDTIFGRKVDAVALVLNSERVIEPGRDLVPKVEDPARVKAILKLVSDVYNGAHLPYSQDGATFTNKEGRLPQQPRGFYKEYTLLTGNAPHTVIIGGVSYQVAPDLSARGSERIIIGGGEKLYYTPDHYAHFIQLTVVKQNPKDEG